MSNKIIPPPGYSMLEESEMLRSYDIVIAKTKAAELRGLTTDIKNWLIVKRLEKVTGVYDSSPYAGSYSNAYHFARYVAGKPEFQPVNAGWIPKEYELAQVGDIIDETFMTDLPHPDELAKERQRPRAQITFNSKLKWYPVPTFMHGKRFNTEGVRAAYVIKPIVVLASKDYGVW